MSEFDRWISDIRRSARDRASGFISAKEREAHLISKQGMFAIKAVFSDADKERYLRDSEDSAIRHLYAFLHDVSVGFANGGSTKAAAGQGCDERQA